jgi:hypothetical protein
MSWTVTVRLVSEFLKVAASVATGGVSLRTMKFGI